MTVITPDLKYDSWVEAELDFEALVMKPNSSFDGYGSGAETLTWQDYTGVGNSTFNLLCQCSCVDYECCKHFSLRVVEVQLDTNVIAGVRWFDTCQILSGRDPPEVYFSRIIF